MNTPSIKKRAIKWLAAASLSSLAVASTSWAQGPDSEPASDRMLQHMTRSLELTEAQQSSIGQIMDAAREQSSADHQRVKELRDQLRDQQTAFDSGKAQALADELGQITTRMSYQRAATHAQVYQQLTAEQQQKMEELQSKRGEHKGRRHGHDKQHRGDSKD